MTSSRELQPWEFSASEGLPFVKFEGWMLKLSSGQLGGRWQKRYFVLEDNELRYFHKEGSRSVKKRFDLRNARLNLGGNSGDPRELVLKFQSRSWHLRAESAEKAQEWLSVLEDAKVVAEAKEQRPRDDLDCDSEDDSRQDSKHTSPTPSPDPSRTPEAGSPRGAVKQDDRSDQMEELRQSWQAEATLWRLRAEEAEEARDDEAACVRRSSLEAQEAHEEALRLARRELEAQKREFLEVLRVREAAAEEEAYAAEQKAASASQRLSAELQAEKARADGGRADAASAEATLAEERELCRQLRGAEERAELTLQAERDERDAQAASLGSSARAGAAAAEAAEAREAKAGRRLRGELDQAREELRANAAASQGIISFASRAEGDVLEARRRGEVWQQECEELAAAGRCELAAASHAHAREVQEAEGHAEDLRRDCERLAAAGRAELAAAAEGHLLATSRAQGVAEARADAAVAAKLAAVEASCRERAAAAAEGLQAQLAAAEAREAALRAELRAAAVATSAGGALRAQLLAAQGTLGVGCRQPVTLPRPRAAEQRADIGHEMLVAENADLHRDVNEMEEMLLALKEAVEGHLVADREPAGADVSIPLT